MRGFTLVETLVYASLASIIGVILVNLLFQGQGIFFQQSANVSQGLSLNQSGKQIEDTISQSSSVASSYTPSGGPTYTSSPVTLVLALPSVTDSGSVIDNTFDYAVITRDLTKETVLKELLYPNAASSRKSQNMVLATNLSEITFLYYDNNTYVVSPALATKINYTIKLSEKAGNGSKVSSSSGQINLKN